MSQLVLQMKIKVDLMQISGEFFNRDGFKSRLIGKRRIGGRLKMFLTFFYEIALENTHEKYCIFFYENWHCKLYDYNSEIIQNLHCIYVVYLWIMDFEYYDNFNRNHPGSMRLESLNGCYACVTSVLIFGK